MLAAHTAWLPLTRRVLVSVACETGGGTRAGKQRSKEAGKRQAGLGQSPQATLAAYNTTQRRGFACELFAAFFAGLLNLDAQDLLKIPEMGVAIAHCSLAYFLCLFAQKAQLLIVVFLLRYVYLVHYYS